MNKEGASRATQVSRIREAASQDSNPNKLSLRDHSEEVAQEVGAFDPTVGMEGRRKVSSGAQSISQRATGYFQKEVAEETAQSGDFSAPATDAASAQVPKGGGEFPEVA